VAEVVEIEKLLGNLRDVEGIKDAIVLSRSGTYIAGTAPAGSDQGTYLAMWAVLLGAAETASMEMKGTLQSVTVKTDVDEVVALTDGPRVHLVVRMRRGIDMEKAWPRILQVSNRLLDLL